MRSIVIHYQEIALKGANRPWFIARLVRHVRAALADLDVTEVRPLMGRVEVVLGPSASWDAVRRPAGSCVRDRQLLSRGPHGGQSRRA